MNTEIQRTNESDLYAVMVEGDVYGNDNAIGWLEYNGTGMWEWESDDGSLSGKETDLHSARSALVEAIEAAA
ncbi:MAG: hypothetical protein OXQ89_24320 [Rhodospirillaceae bacterium]|nr:hypothetical protein [Rhodospirillaceae bacterium]